MFLEGIRDNIKEVGNCILIKMLWAYEKILEEWIKSILKIYARADCKNYREISLFLVCSKIFALIIPTSRFTGYGKEIIGDY